MKRIAVIMSTLGRQMNWLKQAIKSIKSNEREDLSIDIFLHFDGCPIAEINHLCESVTTSNTSIGLGDAMNLCLMSIFGKRHIKEYDFIARMDDDDVALPDRFIKQVKFMENNKDISFCGTLAQIIDESDRVINASWDYANDDGREMADRFLSGGCHIIHPSVLFRADMLYNRGHLWYNPVFRQAEDYDLWFRLIKLGYKYKVLPEPLLKYRMHGGQETKRNNAKKENVYSAIYGFYKNNWGYFLC